jgi:hypothetical protein
MCNALLNAASEQIPDVSRTAIGIEPLRLPLPGTMQLSRRDVSSLDENAVMFYFDSDDRPLIRDVTIQVILGRYIPDSATQPDIDLNPFGAVERGVSRMHAILRRTPNGLTIQDMASSNGTWLSGIRLQPYLPTLLKSGARLQLGQLLIDIRFRSSVVSA